MAIEFIVDTFHEEEKERFKKIIETIKRRPVKLDKRAVFMRKFVLAAMGQYPRREMMKHHEEMLKKLKEPVAVQPRRVVMPMPPKQIVFEFPKNIPAPLEVIAKVPEMI